MSKIIDYNSFDDAKKGISNRRNGHTSKKVRSESGLLKIAPPRDRLGNYNPDLIKKWERELGTGMDGGMI